MCFFFQFVRSLNIVPYLRNNHSLYTKLNNTFLDVLRLRTWPAFLCIPHQSNSPQQRERKKRKCTVYCSAARASDIVYIYIYNIRTFLLPNAMSSKFREILGEMDVPRSQDEIHFKWERRCILLLFRQHCKPEVVAQWHRWLERNCGALKNETMTMKNRSPHWKRRAITNSMAMLR